MIDTVNTTQSAFLVQRLSEVKKEQGILGQFWNGVKEVTGLGKSESKCENMVQAFENGKMSFEEALNYINEFENKQKDASILLSNIATGAVSIAAATVAAPVGGVGLGIAIAKGAPIGALVKTAINTVDRCTNDIKEDDFDTKAIVKDIVSGAATGITSAVPSGIGIGVKEGNVFKSLLNGTKCGVLCGGASGAVSYLTDVAFENDVEFNTKDLLKNTGTSAFVSGTVGALVGCGFYGIQSVAGNTGKELVKTNAQTILTDSTTSSTRKILSNAEKNMLEDAKA